MRRQLLVAVTALCLVQFTDVLGVTVVVTALPSMLASLHAPQSYGTLIATGYAMFFGGLLMLGARLGDRYGHRRVILASLVVFAAGAAVAATASSAIVLTVGRCLQGGAAAVSVPSALRLLTTITTEGPARRRAIAAWSAAGAAAGASGFVVGGIITDLASWRVVFWAYLPLAAVLGAVIKVSVPPDPGGDRPRSLNLAGSAAFTASVMAFVVGTTVIARPGGRLAGGLSVAGCAVLAAAFVLIDRRASAPLLPRQLTSSGALRQGALGGFLNTATTSSVITLVTLYLQNTLHRSPLAAAAALLPFSLAVIAGSALSEVTQRRLRPQAVVAAGLAVIAVADALLIPLADRPWAVPVCAAAGGAGIGLSSVAATGLGTDVGPDLRGSASGLINTAAQVGTAVGIAVLLLIATATSGIPGAGTAPPRVAWAAGAAAAAAGAAWFSLAGFRGRRATGIPLAAVTAVDCAAGTRGSTDSAGREFRNAGPVQPLRHGRCARPESGATAAAWTGAALVIGAGIGVATSFAQARLSMPWAALANSASPWLAGGFVAGALQSRRGTAVATGLSACVLEVLGYYGTSMARGFPASHAYIVFWMACALAGGPVFGLAGWAWRRATGRSRVIGAAFLPGTFFAEAIGAYLLRLHDESAAVLYLVMGTALLAVVGWPVRRRSLLAWTGAVAVVGLIAFGPLLEAVAGTAAGA